MINMYLGIYLIIALLIFLDILRDVRKRSKGSDYRYNIDGGEFKWLFFVSALWLIVIPLSLLIVLVKSIKEWNRL